MERAKTFGIPAIFQNFDLLHLAEADRHAIYHEIRTSNQMQPGYLLLVLSACMIALLGLLINSTAVVIGAMLISPLMNPFLSTALAITLGDWKLGKQALRTTALSIIVAVGICVLVLFISPLKETTPEILARTRPNIMDLLIAFFAGIAGTYTLLVRKGATTIPGVAIATAVMPPLCVTGFGIYHLSWPIASGAFALFATNLVAIVVSASIMFALAHFRTQDKFADEASRYLSRTRLLISLLVLVIISVPLVFSLVSAVGEARERRQIESALRKQFEKLSGAQLEPGWRLKNGGDGHSLLTAALRTPAYLKIEEITSIEEEISKSLKRPISLQLSQLKVQPGGISDMPASTISAGIAPSSRDASTLTTPLSHVEGIRNWIDSVMSEMETIFGVKIESYTVEIPSTKGPPGLTLQIKSDEPIQPGTAEAAERILKKRWERQQFKIEEDRLLLNVRLLPISDPYATIKFEPKSSNLTEEGKTSLERFIRFWKASPSLQPALIVSAAENRASAVLQQRRIQVLTEALKREGIDRSVPLAEEAPQTAAEDELAIRFFVPAL